uniref:Uncharacterized protein n=1 Tax=Anopheles atroparvus TaxID=41427 RepID=A0AAG5DY75_ANOAO
MDKNPKQPAAAAEEACCQLSPSGTNLAIDAIKPAANVAQIRRYCLSAAGVRILDLELHAQNPFSGMLVKSFDPKKADEIFLDRGGVNEFSMQQCTGFRSVVYGLADEYPECLWVKYSLRRMSEAGYKCEVDCFLKATRQAKEFMDALNSAIANNFDRSAIGVLTELVCQMLYMHVYIMVLRQELSLESKLGQMMKIATRYIIGYAYERKLQVGCISIALERLNSFPQIHKALSSIVASNVLSSRDVTELYSCCNSLKLQPYFLMQDSLVMDLLVDSLFRVDVEQDKYLKMRIDLLGYVSGAPSVGEEWSAMITKIHTICKEWPKNQAQGCDRCVEDISGAIHHPVIGACVLRWIEDMVAEPHYFSRCSPVECFMKLVDILSIHHSALHGRILHMLIRLFEGTRNKEGWDIMKHKLYDRLIVLAKQGYVQADRYINLCYERGDIIRRFM